MTYAEHHIGELHEFRVTPRLLENLAQCIERDCQIPTPADATTPEMVLFNARRRTESIRTAVHRILLTIFAAETPVLDTAILANVDSLKTTVARAKCIFDADHALTR